MASMRRHRKWFQAIGWTAMALSVSLLAGASLGSTPGFSSGTWNGYVNYDTDRLKFGIVDAHSGFIGASHCAASTALNSSFATAAQRVENNGHIRHAFWFLTSLHHGQNTCGWNGSAYGWGAEQAAMFIQAIQLSGYDGWIELLFGDVEYVGGSTCSTDLAGWACNSAAANRQVIKGFSEYIEYIAPHRSGVYSSGGQWNSITNQATAADISSPNFWLAYWGATQSQLNWTVATLQNWGYSVASWQYTTDTLGQGCLMTYSTAQNRANTAFNQGYYVIRFDNWDNDQVIQIIDQIPDDCD